MDKILGKIRSVRYGIENGYLFGLVIDFSLDGGSSGLMTSITSNISNHTEYCKWTKEDQSLSIVSNTFKVIDILKQAKKEYIDELKNIPVEVTIDRNCFVSFRVLVEVL